MRVDRDAIVSFSTSPSSELVHSAHVRERSEVLAMCDKTVKDLPMPISSARMPPPVSEGAEGEIIPVIECL
jgi:hypothetical protein